MVEDDLRRKLKKRKGKPGFAVNAALIERAVEILDRGPPYHDDETGKFVSKARVLTNPETVLREED